MKIAPAILKTAVKRAFAHVGFDVRFLKHVSTEESVLLNIFKIISPTAVLDVGANIGQYASMVRRLGYTGTIVSFEAISAVHAALCATADKDGNWLVAPCGALGSSNGKIAINLSKNSVSSSVLPMCNTHLAAAPESIFVGAEISNLSRIDEMPFSGAWTGGPLFLKIDTQGYELEVLKGASGLMSRIGGIQVELSLVPLYEGSPDFAEMVAFIRHLGYEWFSMVPGFRDPKSGRLLQVDGFFIRQDISRLGERNVSDPK